MWIDILLLVFLVLAVFNGLRQGFIIAFFSVIAIIIGLAAAIRLSVTVAGFLKNSMHWSGRWLPVLAFLLVFVAAALLVRWGARLAEAAVDLAMMGWLNKLAGMLLYASLYAIILSVLLFYAVQIHMISDDTLTSSRAYPYIRPLGPMVIDEFGKFVPLFKGMFTQLEDFFGCLHTSL